MSTLLLAGLFLFNINCSAGPPDSTPQTSAVHVQYVYRTLYNNQDYSILVSCMHLSTLQQL
jgi:hypothetical protein